MRAWDGFGWDFDVFPVRASSVFDYERIARAIEFCIQHHVLPDTLHRLRCATQDADFGPAHLMMRLLVALDVLDPVCMNGDRFCNACMRILADGVSDWLLALTYHGVLVEHKPPAGAPFPQAPHWEWCQPVVELWRRDPATLRNWVVYHVVGIGPQVSPDAQRQRVSWVRRFLHHVPAPQPSDV